MITLRIEHKVSSFEKWKKAFDSDPINRKQSGVKRYRIYRLIEDENFVIIELEFENHDQARSAEDALRKIFPGIEGSLISGVQTKILNIVESKDL